MNIDLSFDFSNIKCVGVAVSGGSDSMALLHFLCNYFKSRKIKVVAINVEHGIRGKSSLLDSAFVKEYCEKNSIPLFAYSVDSLKNATDNKLSIEESARRLRYECFFDAILNKHCDIVATAHHLQDNAETVLQNIFRGTGIKGLTGINDYSDKIIRPFISVSKSEIDEYIKKNNIPFVVDETNLVDDYTRNYIRHQVIPVIKKVFPEMEQSIYRLSSIAKTEDEYLDAVAKKSLKILDERIEISLPIEKAIFYRACIIALKNMGLFKDWEKIHVDDVYSLINKESGKQITLPKDLTAVKEYDKIVFVRKSATNSLEIPFSVNEFDFLGQTLKIEYSNSKDYKNGLYLDEDKVPKGALIRTKRVGDKFTKFGGGTKSLSDYLTDKKIPLLCRDNLPLIAVDNNVLAIFGVAVSDNVKIDENTVKVLKITKA